MKELLLPPLVVSLLIASFPAFDVEAGTDEREGIIVEREQKAHDKADDREKKVALGIIMRPGTLARNGAEAPCVVVSLVVSNSAAEKAGIRPDDRIFSIDNRAIAELDVPSEEDKHDQTQRTLREFRQYLRAKPHGTQVSIKYVRNGRERETKAVLTEGAFFQ